MKPAVLGTRVAPMEQVGWGCFAVDCGPTACVANLLWLAADKCWCWCKSASEAVVGLKH
jgi:hypothetical protein